MLLSRFAAGKIKTVVRHVSIQVLFVFLAFALMVVLSYFFAGEIIQNHLVKNSKTSLSFMQATIEAELQKPITVIKNVSQTIRRMIVQQRLSVVSVRQYIEDMSDYVLKSDDRQLYHSGVYGYFEEFSGGTYLSGTGWIPPDDFVLQDCLWYQAAVEANGEISMTASYADPMTGDVVFTYSCRILDDKGEPVGVVCANISVRAIGDIAVHADISEGSYGMLLDENLNFFAHPNPDYIGIPLNNVNHGGEFSDLLIRVGEISEYRLTNYRGESGVIFFSQMNNGWYIGIMSPTEEYYRELSVMWIFLIIVGAISATLLSVVLVNINAAKNISDMKNQQKSNFLATMSHEIRTPMNAILGITEIQLQDEKIEKQARDAWGKVYNSGYVLLNIINDILDLSKIEAGKLEMYRARYETASLINDIVHLNIMRADSKPILFKLELGDNIPFEMIGDELRIKQILNNILSNAFKYTESGEVVLSVFAEDSEADLQKNGGGNNIEKDSIEKNIMLVFKVSDTGYGITEEQIKNLFNEYVRYNMAANRQIQGTGLGLSISKSLINKMNGEIGVKSEVGKGTEFTVRLPQVNAGSGILSKELVKTLKDFKIPDYMKNKQTRMVRRPIPNGRVLVVDDMETNLYVSRGLLAPYRLTIETALSGFEAVDKIKEGRRYDIIFMDHMMPKMDGIETARIIRDLGYTSPIVALTANAVTGQSEIFLNSGFDDFIFKPIDIRLLDTVLNRFIKPNDTGAAEETGNIAIDAELAKIFMRDAERAIAEMEELADYADEENMQTYIINVHAMKSALANVGATELSEFALKLETAGRARDVSVITEETPVFVKELRAFMCKLTTGEEKEKYDEEDDDVPDEDSEYIRGKLIEIKAACEAYDIIEAKAGLNALKQSLHASPTQKIIDTIARDLLHSDFEEAAAVAEQALNHFVS